MNHRRPHPLLCLSLASIVGVSAAVTWAQPQPSSNPFPLRRVIIPLERVSGELQRSGVLVQMPRDEFEARLRKATAAHEAAQSPPRLVKAVYSAELAGQALVNGSGQWTVHHAGAASGILPVPAFNLALSKIKLGTADAVFGNLDGKNLGLWLDAPGNHAVYFDWSARGDYRVNGLAFDLRVPPCPVTIVEIKLPADHSLVLAKNAGMLAGPLATEKPGQQLWRIQATGRSQIEFIVRKNSAVAGSQQVFAALETRQELIAGAVQADFDVNIEAVQTALTEMTFDIDPALQPYEVSLRQAELKNWDLLPPAPDAKGKGPSLVVRLREPKAGALQARIRCLAARPANAEWTSPALRLRQAIPRGETLTLVLPAAHPVDRWEPGQFRLVGAGAEKDGAQTLSLVDLDPEAATPRRPRLTLTAALSDLHVRQQTAWTITPGGMTLSAEMALQVHRGQQFQVGVALPPGGWRVDDLVVEPKDMMRSWSVADSALTIDLQRALDARHAAKLTIRLRAPLESTGSAARVLPIPEIAPLASARRETTYSIHVDPGLHATLASATVPATQPDADQLRAETPPRFVFAYRNQILAGAVRLQGPRTLVDAHVQERVSLHPERGEIEARLEVEPVLGQPTYLDLWISAAARGDWSATSAGSPILPRLERNPTAEAVRSLLLLGSRHGLERATALAHLAGGQRWRLLFDQPLTQKATFVLRGALSPAPPSQAAVPALPFPGAALPGVVPIPGLIGAAAGRRWDIPIVTVLDAERGEHVTVLQPSGLEAARASWLGIKPHGGGPGVAARVYRSDDVSAFSALAVWTAPRADAGDLGPLFDDASLTSYLDQGGQCLHHFRVRVARWSQLEMPVTLPPPARQILALRLDGKWLDRVEHHIDDDGIHVRLPMPADGASHWLDVLYVGDAAAMLGPLGSEATAPMPRLPAAPVSQRRLWRLAPGLAPLFQERLLSLHQGVGSPAVRLRNAWRGADALFDPGLLDNRDDWREPQRRLLLDAESKTRRNATRERTLGEALQELLFDGLKEQAPLVVDHAALRAAGVGPDTRLAPVPGRPFWEVAGLVYVPAQAAPILTSQQRWQDWQQPNALPERLNDSVADAAAHGQDALGQLCRADVWLRREAAGSQPSAAAPLADWFTQGWTEWIAPPDEEQDAALMAVSLAAVRGLGLVAAGLLLVLLALVRGRLSSANRVRLTILLLVVIVFGLFSLPMTLAELAIWPAGLLTVLLLLEYPRFLRAARTRAVQSQTSSQRHKLLAGACVLFAALAGGWRARAQNETPAIYTVYLADAGADRVLAFVRPELLKRFEDVELRALQPAQGAVLIGARYQGKWQSAASDVQAQFDLFSFSEKVLLHVPLGGVDLKEGAFLDGAPVFPTAAPGQLGFQVPVQGKGWHRLTLAMTVRHQAGEHHELRSSIPATALSQIEWQAPAAVANLHVSRAAGDSRLTLDAKTQVQELRVQGGRETSLHLRWQMPSATPPATEHEVREHYYWDLDARGPSLTALLTYAPARGNLSQIQVALPDKTEVRGVEANSDAAALPLAKWQVRTDSGPRRLVVDLAAPASGPFAVQIRLAPRGLLLSENVSLRLPMPLQVKSLEGVLGYRLEGWEITDKTKSLGVTGLTPATFSEIWSRGGARGAAVPTRAYNFRRAAPNASLDLTLQPEKPNVRLELDWQVQATGAALQLQATWASRRELLTAELTLPAGLKVHDVRSANLHHWTVHDRTLRIWLERPADQVSINVAGAIEQPLKDQRFALPALQAPQAGMATTTLTVRAGPGWTIAPERLLHLTPLAPGVEMRFQATQSGYEGTFVLRPAAAPPLLQAHTVLEPHGNHVALTTTMLGWLAPGSAPELTLRLRPWSGAAPRLELSTLPLRQEHRRDGDDYLWSLHFAPGSARTVLIKLRGKIESSSVTVPRVEIDGGKLVDERLTWPAGALAVKEQRGLKELKLPGPTTRHGLAALSPRRPLSTWVPDDPAWRCILTAPMTPDARPGKILLAEQQAQPDGAGRWLHQADWLLLARDLRELRVTLPAEAAPVAALIDGQAWLPHPVSAGGLEIPLPNPSGLFQVRLMWRYEQGQEEPRRPRLAAPTLAEVEPAEVQGTVAIPGNAAVRGPKKGIAENDLRHLEAIAKASLEAAEWWGKKGPADDGSVPQLAWQRHFQQSFRHLEYQAILMRDGAGQAAAARLRKAHAALLKQDTAKGADKHAGAWHMASEDDGTPFYWSGAAPTVQLDPAPTAFVPWWSRETVVLIIIGIFFLSWLPHGLTWFVRLWPEQLAGLALLGYAVWGVSVVGLALLAVAVIGRLFGLTAWLHRLWITPRPAANVEP